MTQHQRDAQRLQVAIAGGGIAGATLALALSRLPHIELALYEASAGFSEIGAGISMGPNAVRVLDWLGLGDRYREVADSLAPPWRDIWFEWRRAQDAKLISTTLAPPVGQSSVHRADLLALLTAGLPQTCLHFKKRVVQAQTYVNGRVSITFTDGEQRGCDVLIGADGIHSRIRDGVLTAYGEPAVEPLFTGTWAWRGLVDTRLLQQRFAQAGFDARLIDIPQMHLGENAHILTFPVKKGALTNIVAFRTDARAHHVALPEGVPWVTPADTGEMLAAFDGWSGPARALLGAISAPTRWALHELVPLPHYAAGNIALIGDAAHAMLPHQGAGAGQGMEDAWLLAQLLGEPSLRAAQIPERLARYDALRRPRATEVQRTSAQAGDLYEMRTPAARTPAVLGRQLETRFDWLWQHDLRQDLREPGL